MGGPATFAEVELDFAVERRACAATWSSIHANDPTFNRASFPLTGRLTEGAAQTIFSTRWKINRWACARSRSRR
jgi:hypothetical protein